MIVNKSSTTRGKKRSVDGELKIVQPTWVQVAQKTPSDWTILVGSEAYPVHRHLLTSGHSPTASGSEFFRGQFSKGFAESSGSSTRFPEVHPKCAEKTVITAALNWLYSGPPGTDITPEIAVPLLRVAEVELGIEDLKRETVSFVESTMQRHALRYLLDALAVTLPEEMIAVPALEVVKANPGTFIVETDLVANLPLRYLMEILTSVKRLCEDKPQLADHAFRAVAKRLKRSDVAAEDSGGEDPADLWKLVDFPSLSPSCMAEILPEHLQRLGLPFGAMMAAALSWAEQPNRFVIPHNPDLALQLRPYGQRLAERMEQPLFWKSGVLHDVAIGLLHGWKEVYREPYSQPFSTSVFMECTGCKILVGAKRKGCDTLALAAMGMKAEITAHDSTVALAEETDISRKEHNGVYWYCVDQYAFGFSSHPRVELDMADVCELQGKDRLSWHLDGDPGWRAGEEVELCGEEWERVMFSDVSSAPPNGSPN